MSDKPQKPRPVPRLILRKPEAAQAMGVSERTLDRMVALGQVARPRRMSDGCVGWRVADLQAAADSLPEA